LIDAYLTTALKCVPPQDKPTSLELKNCLNFFSQEINVVKNVNVIVCLGKIAFDTCIKTLNLKNLGFKFSHGKLNRVSKELYLASSYHPSPRNVNTGRLTEDSMLSFLRKLKKLVDHI
jgi:uracil-DNA glycosylase family 4